MIPNYPPIKIGEVVKGKNKLEGWQSWSIASDLKSEVLKGTVGSNPTPSAKSAIRGLTNKEWFVSG